MAEFPPTTNTGIQNVILSYLYLQYADDDNLQGMVAAYNAYAQAYLDYMNQLLLPIYTNGTIAGSLLDWVALQLYGFIRQGLPSPGYPAQGAYNTYAFNTRVYNGDVPAISSSYYATTDDIFKRILTWHLYRGDGFQFNITWLKRRVARFLAGINGTDPGIQSTYNVNVTFTGARAATITLATTAVSTIFQAAVNAGVLELPFQITWTVTLV